ncbi:TPA: ogr/Delta-like zinc finger family protein [Klebsiella oxytoca]|uniref:ogr/Delta-like zinc finger family protein n=1 Tax=Klebsiella TaxID=570 RepID=UPI000E346E6B|nr:MULTISPECIES: ogr/Delta-like zinc finger family protein [Klebsiella]MDS7905642.1 ogr/Delta-like zinc finger family protein [Klebsiella pasteurii]MDV0994185.1 ogr/Delta-like zinc finger family protein [Klebsiella pasteurii]HDX8804431.1 ogr/Delta-like zinc finger family protein [Klebsiella oxytoca]HEF4885997.1 ogr/Delta-like zinc finger family protein [Klebsiella oxytoca]
MFVCPYCGANARTRTSRRLSEFTIRQYHQCQNLECSESFTTLNTVERKVSKRSTGSEPLPSDFIPRDAFPASHYGRDQLNLAL